MAGNLLCYIHVCICLLMHASCYHRNIQFKSPYPMDNERRIVHHTYLDTIGRPVVVINKNNLVEQHIVDFEVTLHYHHLYDIMIIL